MSKPMADTPPRRPRRRFDEEFKAQAVRIVLDEGKSVGSVARDLDLTETALREWVNRARADRTKGKTGLTTAEREELSKRITFTQRKFRGFEVLPGRGTFKIGDVPVQEVIRVELKAPIIDGTDEEDKS